MQRTVILRLILLVLLHHLPVMLDGDDSHREATGNEESSQFSNSYVYPIKSLLTGIQPGPPVQPRPSNPRPNSSQAGDTVTLQSLLVHQLGGAPRESAAGLEGIPPHPMHLRSRSMLYPYPSRTAIAGPSDASKERIRMASDPFSPVFKPIDGQSTLPISFTEAGLSSTTTQVFTPGLPGPFAPQELVLFAGPLSETAPTPPHSAGGKLFTSFEFKPLPDHTVDQFMNGEGCSPSACSVDSRVSHTSQPGIAQLSPLPSTSGSPRACSRGSGNRTHSSGRKPFPSTNGTTSSQGMHQVSGMQEESKTRDVSDGPSSDLETVELNATNDFPTTGYFPRVDESGHHVAIGAESDSHRLEDEVRIS